MQWRHVRDRHPELAQDRDGVLAAVAAPDAVVAGRVSGEWWFYRRGVGPSRYVKVVVHYVGDEGRIVTAFPRGGFP